jgi:hypothetical protein
LSASGSRQHERRGEGDSSHGDGDERLQRSRFRRRVLAPG